MIQIRIHGRGGQGVVTAAEILAIAAFTGGQYAQAFPSFGSERKGAPVTAFCRMNHRKIRSREPVLRPDVVIIQDPTLLHQVDLFSGLAPAGFILMNSTKTFEDLGIGDFAGKFPPDHVCTVPATDIALEHLGRPLPNAGLVGGFAALTGELAIESVKEGIRQRFPGVTGGKNVAAAAAAYEYVKSHARPKAACA